MLFLAHSCVVYSLAGQITYKSGLMSFNFRVLSILLLFLSSKPATAHITPQSSVAMMPAEFSVKTAAVVVVITILLFALLSESRAYALFRPVPILFVRERQWVRTVISLGSMFFLFTLITIGITGPADPLENPLPLYFWTIWWGGVIALHGLLGNLWYYLNPWSGLLTVTKWLLPDDALVKRTPAVTASLNRVGMWPGITVFSVFALFYLAYPSPDEPFRLAMIVLTYWVWTFVAMSWYGELAWANRGEFISILTRAYARLAPFKTANGQLYIGLPGWQIVRAVPRRSTSATTAIFILLVLGVGSFDLLSGTHLWLSLIDIEPEDYPGRSALLLQTTIGFFSANALLIVSFAFCVWLGNSLVRDSSRPVRGQFAFRSLAIAILPLAFAYHIAHFLSFYLVNSHYALAASTDPLSTGADWLNLGEFQEPRFLGSEESAGLIWWAQAIVLVFGHIVSVLIARTTALQMYGRSSRARRSQLPLASFMVACSYFGLWFFASAKGV